jgi:hypothetical protein
MGCKFNNEESVALSKKAGIIGVIIGLTLLVGALVGSTYVTKVQRAEMDRVAVLMYDGGADVEYVCGSYFSDTGNISGIREEYEKDGTLEKIVVNIEDIDKGMMGLENPMPSNREKAATLKRAYMNYRELVGYAIYPITGVEEHRYDYETCDSRFADELYMYDIDNMRRK